ncbi:MAG: thioredoxin domain-containing protein [Candidatus Saccharimonadales bacterium]
MHTRITIIVISLTIAAIAGGWSFFNFGGQNTQPISEDRQKILAIQDNRLSEGNPDAPIKIVEYVDPLCPYCAKAHQDVIPSIQNDYIKTNKAHYEVRLVAKLTPDSERASRGAYCAAEQDKFWEYINKAYDITWNRYYSLNKEPKDVPIFSQSGIENFVDSLDIDSINWQQCMTSGKYSDTISANALTMSELKAYGTPHFVINGQNYNGAPPYASFKAVIDAELRRLEAAS